MPRRRRVDLFAGARGIVKSREAVQGWIVQRKYDGQYAEIELDCHGLVRELRSKTGRVIRTDESQSMLGVFAGYPNSILVGELMGHTEEGKKNTRTRGYSRVFIFDALVLRDELVDGQPFHARDTMIKKMYGELSAIVGTRKAWWDDKESRARDFHGKFTTRVPKSWKRVPTVENFYGLKGGKTLWDTYVKGGGEGIVWCDPNAPVGKRGAKLKQKPLDTLDCQVESIGTNYCQVSFYDLKDLEEGAVVQECRKKAFVIFHGKRNLSIGDTVEVGFNGFTEKSGLPKFPRILKTRKDLLQ